MIDSRGEAWHGKNTFIHIQQYELIIYTIQLYPLKNKIKYKNKKNIEHKYNNLFKYEYIHNV